MNTFDVGVLDLAKQCNDEPARVILRRGDKNATTITATITDHGDPADTTGLSARFSMRLPDMAHYYSKAATLDGNAVSITINEEQAASTVGKTSIAFFELLDASGNLIASTSAFDVIVLMGAMDGTGIAESYSDELDVAMQQLAEAREDYEEMREDAQAAIDAANAAAESATIVSTIQAAESATQAATSAAQTASQAASDATDAAGHASEVATNTAAAERERVTAETARANAETARANAETARASAESSRVTAEQARTTAESSRAAAETGRSTAESARDDAEQARVTAESARATAEQSRAAAESSRAEAELGRATAESARVTAESARATAETTRATAEQSRATAETARASAESVRVTAEQGRASAENARASAESARVTAESARASAETSRAAAETARATAETARATEWAEIEPAAQAATTAAQSATQSATVAAALATRAAAAATAVVAAASNGNVPYGTLTGTVLTADDAWSAFAKSVGVYGASTQNGTPTPDAPVPIQSVDDLTLVFAGKNLLDPSTCEQGKYYNSAGAVVGGSGWYASDYIPAVARTAYVLSGNTATSASARYCFWDADKELLDTLNATVANAAFTTPDSTAYVTLSIKPSDINACQFEVGTTPTTYVPYVAPTSVSIPLSDHPLRSLPNGTCDVVTLTYQGPSTERESWGVFSKTLVQRVEHVVLDGSGTEVYSVGAAGTYNRNVVVQRAGWVNAGYPDAAAGLYIAMCDKLEAKNTAYNTWTTPGISGWTDSSASFIFGFPNDVAFYDQASFKTWLASNPLTIDYALATPITHDLGTVELPVNPAPDLTAWADGGSAQPTLAMVYEQDINIVISELRSAIADMATS